MSKQMPPVPPANRSPREPTKDEDPKAPANEPMKVNKKAQADNIQQNTRNQGNPTSRGGNPHAR
jgi:hypothetical protein